MNKKKTLIVIGIVVVIVLTLVIIILVTNNDNSQMVDNTSDIIPTNTKGKLQSYIDNLTDNYYIKYHGKFKNNSGELVNAVIEYTKDGKNYGFRSTELDMNLVGDNEKIYSISHRYELIVGMDKKNIDIREYNFASDIGQVFIKSYIENMKDKQYEVEEYIFNGKTLKYYFIGEDIKLIRYDGQDIQIIRIEKQSNVELLKKPDWYTIKNI